MTCLECGRLCEGSYCTVHAREAQARRLRAVAARYGRRHEEKRRAAVGSGGRWEGLRQAAVRRQGGRCALFEVDRDGRRVYRMALIGIPRKSGKTELAAAIAAYLAWADGEPAARVPTARPAERAAAVARGSVEVAAARTSPSRPAPVARVGMAAVAAGWSSSSPRR